MIMKHENRSILSVPLDKIATSNPRWWREKKNNAKPSSARTVELLLIERTNF